jgi:hypothetical protein
MAKMREGWALCGLSGKVGEAVFVRTPYGTVVRETPRRNDPRTPGQLAARRRIAQAGEAWLRLTPEQVAAWRAYAVASGPGASRGGAQAQLLFNRLAIKLLQASPEAAIPSLPPATPFPGDGVRFAVSGRPGGIELRSDRANAPGVATEVLAQRLASPHRRTYPERFRSVSFHMFASGEALPIELAPGFWAVASRFVCLATGEATGIVEHGVFTVSGSGG